MKRSFLFALMLAFAASASAQPASALEGRLLNSLSGDPIAGATVVLEELKTETTSAPNGSFRFDGLAPGRYHVSVRTQGYSNRRTEVVVSSERASA
jgi:hypothetical protein